MDEDAAAALIQSKFRKKKGTKERLDGEGDLTETTDGLGQSGGMPVGGRKGGLSTGKVSRGTAAEGRTGTRKGGVRPKQAYVGEERMERQRLARAELVDRLERGRGDAWERGGERRREGGGGDGWESREAGWEGGWEPRGEGGSEGGEWEGGIGQGRAEERVQKRSGWTDLPNMEVYTGELPNMDVYTREEDASEVGSVHASEIDSKQGKWGWLKGLWESREAGWEGGWEPRGEGGSEGGEWEGGIGQGRAEERVQKRSGWTDLPNMEVYTGELPNMDVYTREEDASEVGSVHASEIDSEQGKWGWLKGLWAWESNMQVQLRCR